MGSQACWQRGDISFRPYRSHSPEVPGNLGPMVWLGAEGKSRAGVVPMVGGGLHPRPEVRWWWYGHTRGYSQAPQEEGGIWEPASPGAVI